MESDRTFSCLLQHLLVTDGQTYVTAYRPS